MKCKSQTWLFIGLFLTFEIDLIFTPNFKCRRDRQAETESSKCIQPCQLLFCPQKEEEESKGPRSTGNCFSEERQHFLSQNNPSPTLTSCSYYIYPTQMCPDRLPAALLPATWSCHSAGALKGEFVQRTEPRNHYTLIHASSIASLQSKVRQNTDSITPCLFWK